MKKYLIIAIITFGANILNAQYVHDLFPCRDSSGTAIEGCIAYSDSLGRYIQVQDTSYCVDTNLVEEFLAANTIFSYVQGDIVISDTIYGACGIVDTASLSGRIDVNNQAIIDTASQIRSDFPEAIDTTSLSNRIDAIDLQSATDVGNSTTNRIDAENGIEVSGNDFDFVGKPNDPAKPLISLRNTTDYPLFSLQSRDQSLGFKLITSSPSFSGGYNNAAFNFEVRDSGTVNGVPSGTLIRFDNGNNNPVFKVEHDGETDIYGQLNLQTVPTDSDNSATQVLVRDGITNEVEGKTIGENEIVFGTANGGVESSGNIEVLSSDDGFLIGGSNEIKFYGISNINIGEQLSETSGGFSIKLGREAGQVNTTGSRYQAIGVRAAESTTSASDFGAFGYLAAANQIDGSFWTAYGNEAGFFNENGDYWLANGYRSAYTSLGNKFTSIGASSAMFNKYGNNWVSIGHFSGFSINGSGWVCIGNQAGRYATGVNQLDSLEKSVLIGFRARPGADTATNVIAIGEDIEGHGSNTATVGNTDNNEFHSGDVGFDVSTTPSDGDIYKYDSGSGLFELVQPESDSIHGWAQYTDTIYTTSNRLSIAAGDTVTLANNAGETITSHLPLGVTSLYNATDTLITPDRSGDSYNIRVDFTASSSSNDGYFSLVLDIGGSQGIILSNLKTFPKGSGTEHDFSTTSAIYTLDTFIANGGKLKIIGEVGTTEIWDINFLIIRTSRARN